MTPDIHKKLERIFIFIILIPIFYILNNWYQNKQFRENPLSKKVQERILKRQEEVLFLIHKKFNTRVNFPLYISDEFNSRLFGLTTYTNGEIKIYLNKKRFKESEDYMIEEVIPHEYAHAMLMYLGQITSKDGHTSLWQKICLELDGKLCERYVDNEELIRQKMGL